MMDNPSTLRRKAAQFFESAASSTTLEKGEKLNEVGHQLELWANELEEMLSHPSKGTDRSAPSKNAQGEPTNS
jgi:hypothetical protein